MQEFQTSLKRKAPRERFYSSMTYEEYEEVFGPAAPLQKPQKDPLEDLPEFELENKVEGTEDENPDFQYTFTLRRLDTIQEIEGSENHTQQLSPRTPPRQDLIEVQTGKRMRVRMRSQSDSSDYLIFNFLQRRNALKRVKLNQ